MNDVDFSRMTKKELMRECERLKSENAKFVAAAENLELENRQLKRQIDQIKPFADGGVKVYMECMKRDVEQMREYGLSYEGVNRLLNEHNDGDISTGKVVELLRAGARMMADDIVAGMVGKKNT